MNHVLLNQIEINPLLYASIAVLSPCGIQNFQRSQSQILDPQAPNEWQIPALG